MLDEPDEDAELDEPAVLDEEESDEGDEEPDSEPDDPEDSDPDEDEPPELLVELPERLSVR
ncbi:hypothetical protein [Saccharopolyspora montiporae]|uniref:hypothetical protein n=1 Tax=Saccharopolyspora montiporae TaxID=2781240 RepID=UPI00351C0F3C